jgi:hypothetical protein
VTTAGSSLRPAREIAILRVAIQDLRSLSPLWPFRQRRHVVVVCADQADELASARRALDEMNAELVLEEVAGPLSAALGRPSVTVADRFGSIGFRAPRAPLTRVLRELERFELACPECGPQAWGDPGS